MPPVSLVVACFGLKGGVGKTAAAVNLAWLASQDAHRTLLWDLDPQAAATFLLRTKAKVKGGARKLLQGHSDVRDAIKATDFDHLDLLPAEVLYHSADTDLGEAKKSEQRVHRVLRPVEDDYDLVVIDCPPGLSLLSTNIVNAADLLLVPLVPSPLSLRTLDHVVELAAEVKPVAPQVMAFFSMVDARRPLHRDVTALVQGKYGDVAGATVPASAVVERMGQRRAPVEVFAPRSPAAAAYRALWVELAERLQLAASAVPAAT